jgi:hypothetical protein
MEYGLAIDMANNGTPTIAAALAVATSPYCVSLYPEGGYDYGCGQLGTEEGGLGS